MGNTTVIIYYDIIISSIVDRRRFEPHNTKIFDDFVEHEWFPNVHVLL